MLWSLLKETASDITAKGYFFEIIYVNGTFTNRLLQGTFNLVDDYNTDNTNSSLTLNVDLNGTDVSLNVTLGIDAETINTRVRSQASTATLTPNVTLYDMDVITAQAEALTIANPTGTAVLGNGFMIDLDDNGSARAITYGNLYTSTFVTLPTTTIAGKRMKLVFQYNGTNWELLNVINEQ